MDDFATFHRQNWTRLEPDLLELYTVRRQVRSKVMALIGGLIVVSLVIGGLMLAAGSGPGLLLFPLIVSSIIGLFGYSKLIAKYRASFKQRIVGSIVHSVNPSLTYDAQASISEHEFRSSRLFTTEPDRFNGEDMVQGRLGVTALRFSEVHAEYESTTTDSDGKRETKWHTIFKGVFFVADFNKHFAGVTVVRPDVAERMFGRMGQKLQSLGTSFSDLQLITLEDPEFEKEFVVLASDQVEARYILSTSLMQRIVEYRQRTGRKLLLSFVDSQINIAIPSNRNLFEPPLFSTCVNPALIREFLEDLLMVTAIVEDLNLNLRIWSKQ